MTMLKLLFILLTISLPLSVHAKFAFSYALNYDSDSDSTEEEESEYKRTYHKIFLGATINGKRTVFLGQNINSWSRSIQQGDNEAAEYSFLELGPKLVWYTSQNYNWYLSLEWNPYVKGTRNLAGTERDMDGSSIGAAIGYRFKLSKRVGFGAAVNYTSLTFEDETIENSTDSVSDKISFVMPMLELTFMTK